MKIDILEPKGLFFDPFDAKPIPESRVHSGIAENWPPQMAAEKGEALARESETFALCWHLGEDAVTAKCTLYSVHPEHDVGALARVFGGQGTPGAAEFDIPVNTLLKWLRYALR